MTCTQMHLIQDGAVTPNKQTTGGNWSMEEKQLHFNALESKAFLLVIQTFKPELEGKHN